MAVLKLNDIYISIISILKNKFPSKKVYLDEIEEGYIRPCFYLKTTSNSYSWLGENILYSNHEFRISYFPSQEYENTEGSTEEINNIEFELVLLFSKNIKIKDKFYITPPEPPESNTVSRVLHFDLELEYWQNIPKEDTDELMEELNLKTK